MRALRLAAVLGVLALLGAGAAVARRHDPEKLPETRVHDLYYGDVLFYYFQNDDAHDFEALTRLLAFDAWHLMPHDGGDAHLLAGGLYLSLGMHNEAGAIFQGLLTNDVPTGVRNRAWFYLAEIWYARGYLDKADAALRRVNGRMSPTLEAQKELLFANVLIHEGRYDEAIHLLSGWRGGGPVSSAYARFNLGVALVRAGRLADAAPFLGGVGTMVAATPEMLALRDRANVALGFAYLQAGEPQPALTALQRVRLNGPYSNKALLGTGWADAARGDYQAALTPWLELRSRGVLDAAVQEAYLAVPYAFSKLNANAQSAEYYESAVTSFASEDRRLDEAIARIGKGELLDALLNREQSADSSPLAPHGWFRDVSRLPATAETPYLYVLLAGHDFQEGVKNYRDLQYLDGTLGRWSDSMVAFQDMIDTRERAYAERLPRADALLASDALGRLQQRKAALDDGLRNIEAQHDVAALGSATEREQWARAERVQAGFAASTSADDADSRAKAALVHGVLYYQLNEAYGARLWQAHRELKDVNLALAEAQGRWIRVQKARENVPANNGEFAQRIAALQARIGTLQRRLADTGQRQSAQLARMAVRELEQQKERLSTYEVQARFALATMYDRAANAEAKPGEPIAPLQKGAGEQAPAAPPARAAPQPPVPKR